MSSDISKLLMIGLKGSGKTTYLAALWHALESGELQDDWSISTLQPNRDYLNAIRNNWLRFKPVGRTSMRAVNDVSMHVRDSKSDREVELSLPDLSGESFRLQWAVRKATKAYAQFSKEVDGVFLFIHPQDVRRTHAIKASAEEPGDDDRTEVVISPAENWDPSKASTQVQLVDVLQIFVMLRSSEKPLRVAVVISAWDTIKARITPDDWLDRRLPLLSQYPHPYGCRQSTLHDSYCSIKIMGSCPDVKQKVTIAELRAFACTGEPASRVQRANQCWRTKHVFHVAATSCWASAIR